MVMRLERSEIRALQAVVDQGGFQKAAEVLHLSQSAVSQSISGLENKIGLKILERGRNQKLTQAGKLVYLYSVSTLNAESNLIRSIDNLKRPKPILSVALNSEVSKIHAESLITKFYNIMPECNLKFKEVPSEDIGALVSSGNVELGLGPLDMTYQDMSQIGLYQDKQLLVVSKSHKHYSDIISGSSSALYNTTLFTSFLENDTDESTLFKSSFLNVTEISSLSLRLKLVSLGNGVCYLSGEVIERLGGTYDLEVIPDWSYSMVEREIGIFYRSGSNLSESSLGFINLCKKHWG
ncbi:LysR family transcriptional regulator [Pseudoalteromonas sp. S16_S37]|uniref:LysR family transcriptional regulator n=1 Tax=Pseudoalteromonas sp. S16_S37 TaxID=2720228 RepID=UPI0016810639|nr:LysR family transcriptional regulator [Pseudoalteromonas sp. S16_S37]MBD1584826.1 LysR family transcriptional regulator [Pseudoalteromonas sp. S16_S37]